MIEDKLDKDQRIRLEALAQAQQCIYKMPEGTDFFDLSDMIAEYITSGNKRELRLPVPPKLKEV